MSLNNSYLLTAQKKYNLTFGEKQESVENNAVNKNAIQEEQQPDTFVKKVDAELKKKSTKTAIAVASAGLLISGFALIFNPRFSPKILNKIKLLQQKTLNQFEKNKNDIITSKFHKKTHDILEKFYKVLEFSNNANSLKDIAYKKLCSEPLEFSNVKNKTCNKILKKIQAAIIYLTKKPNEYITKTFDKISQNTVKKHYKKLNKIMDNLESFIELQRKNLSKAEQSKLDKLLQELHEKRKFFTEEELIKRLAKQEKGMANLENDVLERFIDYKQGFRPIREVKDNFEHINTNFDFWAYDSLIDFRNVIEKEGQNAVNSLIAKEKGSKGVYQQIFELLSKSKNITPENKTLMSKSLEKINKKFLKANNIENVQYFDKKRDLVLGSAPTDILTNAGLLGISLGFLAASHSKEERTTRTMTGVLPIIGGIGTNILFTAKLFSGATGMLMGFGSSIALSKLGNAGNKYLFGYDIDKKEQEIQESNKEVKNA